MFMKITRSRVVRFGAAAALAMALVAHGASSYSPTVLAQGDANQIVSPAAFTDLKWRNVGASRGGRVTGFAGVRQQPHTFYAGATGGGVWKTEDAGITWFPVGDGQITSGSIGSIDVSLSNPDHVWVGTGSAAIRSNVIIGRGVFKSTDAGKNFAFAGLKDAGQIGTIRVHPTNPETVWAAASGSPFGPSEERGIFKTTDGGKTSKSTGRIPMCSMPRRIAASAKDGTSSAAVRPTRAASGSRSMVARRGRRCRRVCRRS
jgi:hypothetical protein